MLSLLEDYYTKALEDGYVGVRGTGEMSWSLTEGRTNHLDLMSYEARLNNLIEKYPWTAC